MGHVVVVIGQSHSQRSFDPHNGANMHASCLSHTRMSLSKEMSWQKAPPYLVTSEVLDQSLKKGWKRSSTHGGSSVAHNDQRSGNSSKCGEEKMVCESF
jgi:hypothetical protein